MHFGKILKKETAMHSYAPNDKHTRSVPIELNTTNATRYVFYVTNNGLTGKQLALLAHVGLRTIEDWRRKKVGPPYKKLNNGRIIYPLATAIEFIENYTNRTVVLEKDNGQ